jgi:hypothetical protein
MLWNLVAPGYPPIGLNSGAEYSPIAALGASLLAWWSADRSDLITVSGAKVTSWKDVKNAYDAVQAVDASRPTYSATGFNGAPGVTFDGTDDELTLASQPFPSAANPSEIWVVLQQDALGADATSRAAFTYGAAAANQRMVGRAQGAGSINRGRASTGDGATSQNLTATSPDLSSRHLLRAIIGATETNLEIDGVLGTPISVVPSTGTTRARIGSFAATSASGFWNGKIRDILVTGPLTPTQADGLRSFLLPRRSL